MATKVSRATKRSLAVLASYEIWACLKNLKKNQSKLKNTVLLMFAIQTWIDFYQSYDFYALTLQRKLFNLALLYMGCEVSIQRVQN